MKLSTLLITIASSIVLSTGAMAEGNWGKTTTDTNNTNTWTTKTTENTDNGQPGTDAWITTKVKASIYSEKLFGDTNPPSVSVTTTNGVVVLSGDVATDAQKKQVEDFVKSQKLDGVKSIDNQLVVAPKG